MKLFTTSRSEFAAIAEAAGTSLEKLLKDAADNATTEGEQAYECIDHDEAVIDAAKLRIKRNQLVVKKAAYILNTVRKYL